MMKIVEVLGVPPPCMLSKASKTKKFFDLLPDGTYVPKKSKENKKVVGWLAGWLVGRWP